MQGSKIVSKHLPSKHKLKHKEAHLIWKRNFLSKLDSSEANSLSYSVKSVVVVEFREW